MATVHSRKPLAFIMGKKRIIILIIISAIFISWHPYTHKETLKAKKLKGRVKFVIENVNHWADHCIVFQNFNKRGQLSEIRYYLPKTVFVDDTIFGKLPEKLNSDYRGLDTSIFDFSHKYRYQYNSKGGIVHIAGVDKEDTLFFEKIFEYNSKDSLVKQVSYYYENGKVRDSSVTQYMFETSASFISKIIIEDIKDTLWVFSTLNNNKIVKKESYRNGYFDNISTIELFDYNKRGLTTRIDEYSFNKETQNKTPAILRETEYDENEITSEKTTIYSEGQIDRIIQKKYSYESGLTKTVEVTTNRNDTVLSYNEVYYDKFQNIIKYIGQSYPSEFEGYYEYKYDDYGNWIEMTPKENGENGEIVKREIKYYNE